MERKTLQLVKVHEKEATTRNTDQLYEGKDSKGKNLPKYSETSINVFGKRPGPWQLFNEGDFYNGFFVRVENGKVLFNSNDSKTGMILNMLIAKGHDEPLNIFGLNTTNFKDLVQGYVRPDLGKFVRDTIRKG